MHEGHHERPPDGGFAVGGWRTPLVGRATDLQQVAMHLARGGCLVLGEPGVGKTRLAQEAAARRQAPVIHLTGTEAGSTVPFAAAAHVLSGIDVDDRGVVACWLDHLRARTTAQASTMVIDDVHLLDRASTALVLAASRAGLALPLMTMRRSQALPDVVRTMWADGTLGRHDLAPLDRRGLELLVEGLLQGPVEAAVHRQAWRLSRGNPLVARELLADATAGGTLRREPHAWVWTSSPLRPRRLLDIVAHQVGQLPPAARDAMDVLSLGEPVPLDELVAVAGEEAVGALEEAGLASVGPDPQRWVRLVHPVLAEVARASLGAVRARGIHRRLADAIGSRPDRDPAARLRQAVHLLDAGEHDPDLFLQAGRYALQVQSGVPGPGWEDGDPRIALRLADGAGEGLAAGLLAGRALTALSRFGEAADRLEPHEQEASQAPADVAGAYAVARVNALHWAGRTDAALELLDRVRGWAHAPDWTARCATAEAWILNDQLRSADAVARLRQAAEMQGLGPSVRLDVLVVLAVMESRLGLVAAPAAVEPELQQLVDGLDDAGVQTGWARHTVDAFVRSQAAVDLPGIAARLGAARDLALANGDRALPTGLAGILGRLHLLRGHVRTALPLATTAVEDIAPGDPSNGLGWWLCQLARVQALAGDAGAARGRLQQAEDVIRGRGGHLRLALEVQRAHAWAEVAGGQLTAARERLWEVVEQAGQAVALQAEALHDLVRFGESPARVRPLLAPLATPVDSPLIRVAAAHVDALAAQDTTALHTVAERFAQLGLDLFAAEAARQCALLLTSDERPSTAGAARALSARHAARCRGAVTPLLEGTDAGQTLTRREREVAMLAARGASNADIAAALVLSVRTVETYVLRACHKLGITSRTDLADVLVPHAGDGDAQVS